MFALGLMIGSKRKAAAVLATIGLTVSVAFRLMMMRIAKDKALPMVPNVETIEAMMAARRGDLVTVGSPSDLLKSLNVNDLKTAGKANSITKPGS